MKTPTFKKGQWLISRWKKEHGGETDLCKFDKNSKNSQHDFIVSQFVRFKGKRIVYCSIQKSLIMDCSSFKSLQWRPATKAELKKYSQLIFS